MLFILISTQINLDIIFLVMEVASSPVRVMITLIIDASIPCLVEIQALTSIFGAASWTWREVVMLAYLSEALVASCLHRSVGTSSIPACSHHLLSPHFELVLHEPVVVRVLQVGMPISKSAVAGQLRRKLGIHGLREVRRIFALRTIITLEEVVQAWWPSDCLLLRGILPLSLQLLVLYIVSCLLSHIH